MLGAASTSFAKTWRRAPTQVLGPFYPIHKPLDADADLARVRGREARANIVLGNG